MNRAYFILLAAAIFGLICSAIIVHSYSNDEANMQPALDGHEKTYAFLRDVLGIDSSEVNITFNPPLAAPAVTDSLLRMETFTLQSNEANSTLTCDFYDDKLYSCLLDLKGSNQAGANITEAAQTFLEKYQAYTGLDSIQMAAMLTNTDPLQGATITSGDLVLVITHKDLTGTAFGDTVNYRWSKVINGCDYQLLNLGFTDGAFSSFIDNRQRYTIGDTTVNVSKEQAITIALNASKNYSYKMSDNWTVTGFDVLESRASAVLKPQTKEGNVLCPMWTVTLPLNGTYPGSVTEILVTVWAGNGEVGLVHHQAYAQLYPNPPVYT